MVGLRTRYRPPGAAIDLILSSLAVIAAVVIAIAWTNRLLGTRATLFTAVEPDGAVGQLLTGLVQVAAVASALMIFGALLRRRRYRLLATLTGGAVLAGLAMTGLENLFGSDLPADLTTNLGQESFLTDARHPDPALFAGAAAVLVAVGPWLSASWRRAAWLVLGGAVLLRLVSGTVLPMQLVLAITVGCVVGGLLLIAFGTPDRRAGPGEISVGLADGGLPVVSVVPASVTGTGARPFVATTADGRQLFVKAIGQDERDADLLYRAYRSARLRGLGDVRPAASLRQAVEHQALVGLMAEQSGVQVPHIDRIAEAGDGSALLAMDFIDGRSLAQLTSDEITDEMLERLWLDVDRMHAAGIAHRSLRTANVMVDGDGTPWIVDFSFSELVASDRQVAVDVAELLASLAIAVGPDRAVDSARAVIGPEGIGPAVRLLQPLALSAATRRAAKGEDKLLARTRAAAAEASGEPVDKLEQLQRVRPRALLTIAALSGAFYFLLPQLAQVDDAWEAFQDASFGWIPVIFAMSMLTYVGSAISTSGAVPQPLRFGPTLMAQAASSFVNRVTPAGAGGMVLNTRYLQKSGVAPAAAVAAVGLNTVAGAVVHLGLLVVFVLWSGRALNNAFKLPSASRLLVVIAVLFALAGALMATRWGRRRLLAPVVKGLRSSLHNLRKVAKNPTKLALLFGGSALTTGSYVAAMVASVVAFGGDLSVAQTGAVYLGASTVAAAAPTPGNLGAIEAALVAGLTGVGLAAGPAVSIVLTYRLATYWLPVVPGWIAWTIMQRRNYV